MNEPTRRPTRRQFVLQGGTLLGAGLAVAAAAPPPDPSTAPAADADTRLALLPLQGRLLAVLTRGDADVLPELFTAEATLQIDAMTLQGTAAISHWLATRAEGKAPYHRAYRQAALRPEDEVHPASGGAQATLRFHVEAEACTPLTDDCTAAQMARLQGLLADRQWEQGMFEAQVTRRQQGWRVEALSYRRA
ncbi:MAG: hypothetical protein RL026_908 [Pseudomonadota bacterium]|jgi:hypothetical protein